DYYCAAWDDSLGGNYIF
nr:immunoglobulin light chain junction region [Macaca mulatta]MOW17224.1 immunoglobulin light chain junction region [Macaca mulatta]